MTVRALVASDVPILRESHARSGFAYEFPDLQGPLMASVMVVAGDDDEPLISLAAEEILQGYLFVCKPLPPFEQYAALKWLEREMTPVLRQKGFREINLFIPPDIYGWFSRLLKRRFGFVESWRSLGKHF